jgi:iron complex outermembrane receptor protein
MYTTSSVGSVDQFNTMDRARNFDNVDLSALVRYTPNANIDTDLGLSRTARAPNLYELYDWSRHLMALEMNNFVGDGNGYLGNPYLKPEIANKVSATFDWHTASRETAIRFSPYYSYVEDYIDAVQWNRTTNLPASPLATNQYVFMKYMNEDARLYGFDLSAKAPIAKTGYGDFSVAGMLSYTNGRDISLDTGLYNIMPFNGKLALIHKRGGWQGIAEVVGVSAKDDVSAQRNEMKTPGYGLLNLRGAYTWDNIHLNFGVENVLDKLYYLPLGGAYLGEGATMSFNNEAGNVGYNQNCATISCGASGTQSSWGTSVAGPGRTFYVGMKVDF